MNSISSNKDAGAAIQVAETIRSRIRRRELSPGEPVRQQDMAEELGVSRVPVREALGMLVTEGILDHDRHRGYFVAKLDADDLEQIYLMRRALETALFRELAWPGLEHLSRLQTLNEQLELAAERGAIAELVELNRRFHESIFELSSLRLVQREVQRLWAMAAAYHALYLYGPGRLRIATEHRRILDALARRDRDALIAACDAHRQGAQDDVSPRLATGRSEA